MKWESNYDLKSPVERSSSLNKSPRVVDVHLIMDLFKLLGYSSCAAVIVLVFEYLCLIIS